MKHIVKRKGHSEPYDERKVYASVYASCLSVRVPQGEAELVAEKVSAEVAKWIADKPEVTSGDIYRTASIYLNALNTDAGWIYKHHRIIG